MSGSGDVINYDSTKKMAIASAIAAAAGVSTADVLINVAAGSVVIEATIVTASASAQSAALTAIQPSVATAVAASSLLSDPGVSVLEPPSVETRVEDIVLSRSQPPLPPASPPVANEGGLSGAAPGGIIGGVAALGIFAAFALFLYLSRDKKKVRETHRVKVTDRLFDSRRAWCSRPPYPRWGPVMYPVYQCIQLCIQCISASIILQIVSA